MIRDFSLAFALATMLIYSTAIQAELPPQEYEKLLANATHVGTIEVLEVKTISTPADTILEVTVKAKMLTVEKADDGLKVGDPITIAYMHVTKRPEVWTGAAPIPLLVQGKKYRAHLLPSKVLGTYNPAARSKSFTTP